MRAHIVQPGEHLAGICARIGATPDDVWNAPDNEELRELRQDGSLLAPGDLLYLPEPVEEPVALQANTTNRYRAQVATMRVPLRLHDGNEPMANEPYRVEGVMPALRGATDGEGSITLELPATTQDVTLVLPERERRLRLMIGHLDPHDTASGVRARLTNLGYFPLASPPLGAESEVLAAAIAAFQRDNDLPETGELDDDTRDQLDERHGG